MFQTKRATNRDPRPGRRSRDGATEWAVSRLALLVFLVGLSACDGPVLGLQSGPAGDEGAAALQSVRTSNVDPHLGAIHELQSAFHGALRNSDAAAMRSLWTEDATLVVGPTEASGVDAIVEFFEGSPPFVNGWAALAPTYKSRVERVGNRAQFAFECVYVPETGNLAGQSVTAHLNASGTMRKVGERWLFEHFQGGVGPLP